MKKRLLSLLLVLCLTLSLLPMQAFAAETNSAQARQSTSTAQPAQTVPAENPFKDVHEGDWFYDGAMYAYVNGFFNGTSSTTFGPDGTMSRGMFVTVLGRMAGVDTKAYDGTTSFSDVPESMYYAPYVAWAAKHGITTGVGDGKFDPNMLINRQQMATFFMRYFETFNVDYATDANITTVPADMDSVAPYARDAVLKLWKNGLLNGDGVNFNPSGNASRAQSSVVCMRTDKAVAVWYKEPGVASQRVSIDPAAVPQKPAEEVKPSTGGGSSSSGGSKTIYYEVRFDLGSGQADTGITLPATSTYASGTRISTLPTPTKSGVIFLGWYYDADMVQGVETDDTVQRNMTLYAKVAAGEEVTSLETPNYITRVDVTSSFSFQVKSASRPDSSILTLTYVTGDNQEMTYGVQSSVSQLWTITANFEPGQTYQAELKDDSAVFVLDGAEQSSAVRYLNILTQKAEITNASLNAGIRQISAGDTNISEEVFDGLYQIDELGRSTQNVTSGTFTYSNGTLNAGDTVAITSADADLNDVTSTDGDVAYVKITSVNGNTYSYEMADVEDVLFIPDVLPISRSADTDEVDNQITISTTVMADAMTAAEAKALDEGDFIGLYTATGATGATGYQGEDIDSYGKITDITDSGDSYVITYTVATLADVEGALDVYYTQDRKIELTDAEKNQISADIKSDVQESGYVEEAALYLASVMLESDNLKEIPDMEKVSESMRTMQASAVQYGNSSVTRAGGGNSVKVEFDRNNINVKVKTNTKLDHLQGNGFDVEVNIPFTVTINDNVEIKITATFEEEVILKQKVSTSRHKIGFLKYDYTLNASFEVGNYTGIAFTADVSTKDGGDDGSMIKKLDEIMERMKDYQEADGVGGSDGSMDSLSKIYASVMKNANDAWIDILSVQLFDNNGNAFLHIFCWQVKGSFVVSANLCVSMGMSFDYTMQKQYNFSVRVKAKTSTNQTVDIIEPQYNFDFYVVGTLGIRAGLRLEMYVGLISLKLDKIGITAEVGAYARLWGYFFYHLQWTQSNGKKETSAGAMLIEIGIYLEIKFVAQAFSSSKLTWNPTLYANEWPLWSAGVQQNVYAFQKTDDTNYTLQTVKTLALPSNTYTMNCMDLKSGETSTIAKDDNSESSFIITFSNPAFQYNAANNTVTVTPATGSLEEETDMVITWKAAALSFTSKPIQKSIHLSWSDPDGVRYISFDTQGGSAVAQISAGANAAITWPANPMKQGYIFAGWYTEPAYTNAYTGSTTVMPAFSGSTKGMTLYANWTPAVVSYTVEHYQQKLNGTYELAETQRNLTGTTGVQTSAVPKSYTGFAAKDIAQQTIAADGSTLVKVYYDRNIYTVTFKDGVSEKNNIIQTYRHGAELAAPKLSREGYTFNGWNPTLPEIVTESAIYTADWTSNSNTVIFNSQGGSNINAVTVQTGEKMTQPANPTRDGYTFDGWYKDDGCTNAWNFSTDTVTGTTTLYAKWTQNTYTVTFNDNGHGTAPDALTNLTSGSTINEPTAPTATGWTFGGWYKEDGCTNAWNFGTDKVTASTTLYAKWTRNTYTVTFNANGHGDTPATMPAVLYGSTITAPTVPTATDWTFDGWYKEVGCKNVWDFSTDTVTGPTTLYAKWTQNTYTVTFNANGHGTAPTALTNLTSGSTITAPTAPTETGWTFDGWYKDPACSNANKWNFDTDTVTGPTTLYAKWTGKAAAYTVHRYLQNIADNNYTDDSRTNSTAVGTSITITPDSILGFTYDGTHAGTVLSGTVPANGTLELSVYYTRNTYNVTFDAKDHGDAPATMPAVRYGSTIDAPAVPTAEGYTFVNWYKEAGCTTAWNFDTDTVTASTTLYAKWTQNTYTVTFDANGHGDTPATMPAVLYGSKITAPTVPTETGYTFGGWYKEAGCTTAWNFETDTVTGPTTLYAKWTENEPDTFIVTFDANGHGTAPNALPNLTSGSKITAPTAPTETGWTFGGWYKDAACTNANKWDFNTDTVTGTITLYAKWTRNTYTVTFDANGRGTATGALNDVRYGDTISAPTDPTETGWTFGGWYKDAACTDVWIFNTDKVTGPTTLYAKWTRNTYTVTFNANGRGTATGALNDVRYGDTISAPTAPTADGYTFGGWYKEAGCNNAWDFDTDTVTGPTTLYAKWAQITYTVTFNTNGHGNEPYETQEVVLGGTISAPTAPTETDWTFGGWYKDADCTDVWIFNTDTVTGPTTLYAQWTDSATIQHYSVFVAGTEITSQNMDDVLRDGGSVKFTPAAINSTVVTLTLNNANISAAIKTDNENKDAVIKGPDVTKASKLIINLIGDNTVTNTYSGTDADYIFGISCDAICVINGPGTLHVSTEGTTATTANCAIYSYYTVSIDEGATVEAYAGKGPTSFGLAVGFKLESDFGGMLYLPHGTVKAKGYSAALNVLRVADSTNSTAEILTFIEANTEYDETGNSGKDELANEGNCKIYKSIEITHETIYTDN